MLDQVLNLIWMFWQFNCAVCDLLCLISGWDDMLLCRPCFEAALFYCFHQHGPPLHDLSLSYTLISTEGNKSKRDEWKKRGWLEWDKRVTTERWRHNSYERKNVKKRARMYRLKNKNERKKKGKQRQVRKSEMGAIHKQTRPEELGPAHLLLFTSEEIDTLWKRGSWPQDKTAAAPN